MISINAGIITIVGVLVVFVTLFILSELLRLLSAVLPKPHLVNPEKRSVDPRGHDDGIVGRDIPIIAVIMKQRGHTGILHIREMR